jgi:hypothetical protein
MLQRIQTVYLLGAFSVILALFFTDVAIISASGGSFNLNGFHISHLSGNSTVSFFIWLKIFGYMLSFLILLTVFLYKNRKIQMKLCILNIFIALALLAMLYYMLKLQSLVQFSDISFQYPVLFPLVAVVLLFMAYRAILKDDRLIKSLDRLR